MKRVLMMLDGDGNPDNGLQIPAAVSNGTLGSTLNWSSTDPDTDFAPLLSRVRSIDPAGTHNWPTAAAIAAHFDSTWPCAMVGNYSGNLTGPTYTDTNGVSRFLGGTIEVAVMPTGVTGTVQFGQNPYQFDGEFRLSGSIQAGATATAVATGIQYVDGGEFAPQVGSPLQPPLSISLSVQGAEPLYTDAAQGSWSAGGYSGVIQNVTRPELATNNNGTTDYQSFSTAIYRFFLSPIWVGTKQGADAKAFRLEADAAGNVWANLTGVNSNGTVIFGKIATDGSFNLKNTSTNTTYYVGGYEWQFAGTLHTDTLSISGTLSFGSDGSSVAFDSASPLKGCSMWGETKSPP